MAIEPRITKQLTRAEAPFLPRWAIDAILDRGYAFATMYYGDIDPDFHDGFENGVHGLYSSSETNMRQSDDWASIAGWAWGLSRGLDYLETDSQIDGKRVALMGGLPFGQDLFVGGCS